MEYSIGRLARLSGVSARALRHYEQLGLLRPGRVAANGYRVYGAVEVDRLQQILFFRELGLSLADIRDVLDSEGYDAHAALGRHLEQLRQRSARLSRLIATVEKTLATLEGEVTMTDEEKFEGFAETLIAENEASYGAEARARYGDGVVEAANARLREKSPAQFAAFEQLQAELNATLRAAYADGNGDPAGELAQKAAALHKDWLCFWWDQYDHPYTPQAHRALTRMYVDDPRFTAYYDAIAPGSAPFLRDAVAHYTAEAL